jgi:hypothetical protein
MKRVAFVHSGSFFHIACTKDPSIRAYDPDFIYWPEYNGDFSEYDSVFLAARNHPQVIADKHDTLLDFMKLEHKKIYLDGMNCVGSWLTNTHEIARGTCFWAWRTGEDLGRVAVNTDHYLWRYLSEEAVFWHYHAVFEPPCGAQPLVILKDTHEAHTALAETQLEIDSCTTTSCGDNPSSTMESCGVDPWGLSYRALPNHKNALLYYDHVSFPAELVVSSMDASYHHGSGFMPGASQLLYRMLRWLSD